jgi:hypothetical protein
MVAILLIAVCYAAGLAVHYRWYERSAVPSLSFDGLVHSLSTPFAGNSMRERAPLQLSCLSTVSGAIQFSGRSGSGVLGNLCDAGMERQCHELLSKLSRILDQTPFAKGQIGTAVAS